MGKREETFIVEEKNQKSDVGPLVFDRRAKWLLMQRNRLQRERPAGEEGTSSRLGSGTCNQE